MSSRDNLIPSIGDVLMGRYRIESFVARGGMGVVMRARQLSMDREVAIKMILPQYADNEKTLARFDREVHLAKQLRHPNIVELYDYGSTEAGVLYLVMEFLEGEDLKTLLRRDGPMPVGRAGKVALQVLDALAEAHTQDIVHRDLKPSNIFVTQMRRLGDFAKLLDFGIAKSLAEDASEVTAQGEICGTSSYMAPEMFVQGAVGTTVDVYAMGLILLEMLLGKKVFSGQSSAETLVLHLRKEVVIPPPFAATNLSHVLTKALAKHPRHRYDNAVEFLEDLEPALDSLDGSMRISEETIARYSQDLSEDGGLLDQVLAGPWASGMTEPESGSSDIVVMPGVGATDEPEEFEAAVTQLIERAKDDFVQEEEAESSRPREDASDHDAIRARGTPSNERPTVPDPGLAAEPGSEQEREMVIGKETMKMPSRKLGLETVKLDESDMLPLDEDVSDPSIGDEPTRGSSDTPPQEYDLAQTQRVEEVATGTMTGLQARRPWWRTRAALIVFALCCVALFAVALVVPLVTGGSSADETAIEKEAEPEEPGGPTMVAEPIDDEMEPSAELEELDEPAKSDDDDESTEVAAKVDPAPDDPETVDEPAKPQKEELAETREPKPPAADSEEETADQSDEQPAPEKEPAAATRKDRRPEGDRKKKKPLKLEVPKFD